MNGILESKNNFLINLLIGLLLFIGCKEKPSNKIPLDSTKPLTNIRFATIKDGYKEKSTYKRLTTDKTEVTSTVIQMEGPAWENENVGFRNYFDARNGMDIFGKRKSKMILDSVGIDENYHELQDWGMDVLKVGNSLGAGAIAMIINDTLYRVGIGADADFKIIQESPELSSLEFRFKNWPVLDRKYNVTHTITIKSGTHFYEGKIQIQGLKGDETPVTGIVDHGVKITELKSENHTILSSFGLQDVEGKALGMAIAVANENYKKWDSAKDYKGTVDKTHLVHLKGNSLVYKFFAGWELQDEAFKSKNLFEKMINKELDN